jgi:hypothetical protein
MGNPLAVSVLLGPSVAPASSRDNRIDQGDCYHPLQWIWERWRRPISPPQHLILQEKFHAS